MLVSSMSFKTLLEPHALVFQFGKYPPSTIALIGFVRGLSENSEIRIESVKGFTTKAGSCPLHLLCL